MVHARDSGNADGVEFCAFDNREVFGEKGFLEGGGLVMKTDFKLRNEFKIHDLISASKQESNAAILCPHYNQTPNRKNFNPPSEKERETEKGIVLTEISIHQKKRKRYVLAKNPMQQYCVLIAIKPLTEKILILHQKKREKQRKVPSCQKYRSIRKREKGTFLLELSMKKT
ncbi:hypothetical protein Cgig2_009129 [Carnegiea gigantea]|uniref:Uncharacterized protein n=1 Tax=Carnegiea gigantea TaxID=171969 RepID=A0A9Q1QAS7_9CARY|nr:hypothetical protein Cgig2_009129 [Carnegiea gigantea]